MYAVATMACRKQAAEAEEKRFLFLLPLAVKYDVTGIRRNQHSVEAAPSTSSVAGVTSAPASSSERVLSPRSSLFIFIIINLEQESCTIEQRKVQS